LKPNMALCLGMWREGKNMLLGTTFEDCEIGEEKKTNTRRGRPCLCHKAHPAPFNFFYLSLLLFSFFFFFSFKFYRA
jgi:hypothetical protein